MQPRHIALAFFVALFWGFTFVVIAVALEDVPPLLLGAARFLLAGLPCLFLPRPAMRWRALFAVAMALYVGQFSLLFTAMSIGMPAGLASIGLQIQVFLTILFAALIIGERPNARQASGGAVALLGLVLIATTIGTNGVTLAGFLLLMCAASCWAVGNILLRRAGSVDMLAVVSWASLLAAGPLFLMSLIFEGPERMVDAVTHATWLTAGAIACLSFIGTTFGYGAWAHLMRIYPPAVAAPFALLVPVFGTLLAALFLGETFGYVRLFGMVLILAGLGVVVLPLNRWRQRLRFGR